MKTTDYEKIIEELATKYNIEVAVVKAVQEVESGNRSGFLSDGRPQILFEGHVFYKLLKQKYGETEVQKLSMQYPTLIYKQWTRVHYLGGLAEHDRRLTPAAKIDRECALKSTSFGMFQIMGFNYKACGCDSLQEFVNSMYRSAADQVVLFFNFINSQGLMTHLRNKNWISFARAYNGPSYTANNYHNRLKAAYNSYKNRLQK